MDAGLDLDDSGDEHDPDAAEDGIEADAASDDEDGDADGGASAGKHSRCSVATPGRDRAAFARLMAALAGAFARRRWR